jgi:hypothetical protein
MLIIAGLLLVYPRAMFDSIGIGLVVGVILLQKLRHAQLRAAPG